MVVGEGAEAGGVDAQGGEGAAEGLGLADAAEGGNGGAGGNAGLIGDKPGKKDGAFLVVFSDFLNNSLIIPVLFRAGDDGGAGAGEGGEGLAEAA